MRTLLAKKTIWMYITIGMILLPGMLVNNARGVGGPPKCSTCTKWQYDGIDWGCYGYNPCPSPQECCPDVGCYNRLTSCKGCDNNGEHLLSYCLASDCETCDGSTGSCKICDGNEYQRCCGGECYDIRTQGCCSGQIYSYNDCKICNYEVEVPVPVCICDYEPNAYCCGDGHCCPNGKTCCPPNGNCCDPCQCQTCDGNGNCVVCDGDPKKCCVNGVCKGPICDNCHSISDTVYECGHYESSTTCASDFCIIDELATATCDYHPDSTCPSDCRVEAVAEQPAVWQRKVNLNSPNCLTGGEPVQYEDWRTTYQGCATCSIQTWRTSCETFGCPGTIEYSAPRGDKMACAGTCP